MNKLIIFFAFSFLSLSYAEANVDRPKLVVGIVVDQMRWDYLYKFNERYSKKGFKRLLKEGFSFDNCMINYVPSYTAIGHSTVYTGSIPSIHGISGNNFIDQKKGRMVYCSEDRNVTGVGEVHPKNPVGQMSPLNLKTTTVTDQLRYATNFRSKVIGVSLKDRGSIFPAGHSGNAAFWLDYKTGNWITSSWYMESLPKWLQDYNAQKRPEKFLRENWNPTYPIETYVQSPKNGNGRYEHPFRGLEVPSLPLMTASLMEKEGPGLVATTPYGNTITIDVAKLAIENESLGQGKDTDFLAISFSAPDKIAHHFSVNSIFVEDSYLKLDHELGDFLSYLDKKVGKKKYLVFLTADHGGTPNARFMNDHKIPGSIWMTTVETSSLNKYLKEKMGETNLVLSLLNYQVHFNYKKINEKKINIDKLKVDVIKYLENLPAISYAVDVSKVASAPIPKLLREKIINGYNRERSGEIQFILKPGWYDFEYGDPMKGGTHGTWSPDDSHIPFILMGHGVKPGSSNREVYMTDIAPTIASLLKIQAPNGNIGKIVYPVE